MSLRQKLRSRCSMFEQETFGIHMDIEGAFSYTSFVPNFDMARKHRIDSLSAVNQSDPHTGQTEVY